MSDRATPQDLPAEYALLGVVFLSPKAALRVAFESGVRSDCFTTDATRGVWDAVVSVSNKGQVIDEITVRAELERLGKKSLQRHIGEAIASGGSASAMRQYAARVVEIHEWKKRQRAASLMLEATDRFDLHAFGQASAILSEASASKQSDSYSPERLADVLGDFFSQKEPPPTIPLPLHSLNQATFGGLWPGEVMVIGGHTNHGKSVWADQILDGAADAGYRVHAYLTEMSAITRGLRMLSRRTRIPFGKLRMRTNLNEREMKAILDVLESLPYGVTIASNWDIDDVVRDALSARWDLVVIDLLHGFRYEDERGLDKLSKAMQRLAITSTTIDPSYKGMTVVPVAHLNRGQGQGGKRPRPRLSDLKGGSSIEQDADIVNFVWLEDDENGTPGSNGEIWFAKGRSSTMETQKVELNPVSFQFVPRSL